MSLIMASHIKSDNINLEFLINFVIKIIIFYPIKNYNLVEFNSVTLYLQSINKRPVQKSWLLTKLSTINEIIK